MTTAMRLDDQTKAALSSVSELTKQLVTLGTAVLTLEVSLLGGFVKSDIPLLWQLQYSWMLLLISIVAGIWTLMAITGTIAQGTSLTAKSVYSWNIRIPAFVQITCFGFGIACTMWYGVEVLGLNR